jgi:hypothetical protein
MSAPTTAISNKDITITWVPIDSGGRPITSYQVYIKASDDTFKLETTTCAVSATTCSISLLALQADPFNLELGDLV